MKICEKCGAYNSDDRLFCVDCNEKLGQKLSEAQEAIVIEKTKKTAEKLYNRKDPLHISLFDKIAGIACLACGVAFIAFLVLFILLQKENELLLLGIIFAFLGAFEALVPSVGWTLEKLRLSLTVANSEDLTPSDFYFLSRKLSEGLCLVICVAVFVISSVYLFRVF